VSGGPSSFHECIWEGQIEDVANLLSGSADPNQRDEVGRSPILIAAIVGSAGTTRLLLEAGADVESRDPSVGATAIMQAASTGHLEILKALLGAGGDVEAQDTLGGTALIWAAEQRQIEAVALLLGAGADPNVRTRDGRTALSQGCWVVVETRTEGSERWTRAVKVSEEDGLVRLLMNAGAVA